MPDNISWVIMGQDEKGNILATTNRPLGSGEGEEDFKFELISDATHWFTFENDLNKKCEEDFSGVVQGNTINARSMTMEDVDRLTGFVKSEFKPYTFKDVENPDAEKRFQNYKHYFSKIPFQEKILVV